MTEDDHAIPVSPRWQRHRAALALAGLTTDARQLAEILDMVGLHPGEGLEAPAENREPAPDPRRATLADATTTRLTESLRAALRCAAP